MTEPTKRYAVRLRPGVWMAGTGYAPKATGKLAEAQVYTSRKDARSAALNAQRRIPGTRAWVEVLP